MYNFDQYLWLEIKNKDRQQNSRLFFSSTDLAHFV